MLDQVGILMKSFTFLCAISIFSLICRFFRQQTERVLDDEEEEGESEKKNMNNLPDILKMLELDEFMDVVDRQEYANIKNLEYADKLMKECMAAKGYKPYRDL